MAKEFKELKLDDSELLGDYLEIDTVFGNEIGITAVNDGEEATVLLSHVDARKLAEFILENIEEER